MTIRAEEVFATASEMDAAQCAEYLLEACAGNDNLRNEVEALLAAANNSDAYFSSLAKRLGGVDGLEDDWKLPSNEIIGPYRLLRLLGRGGMGAVYLAERADEQFEKRVALKILPVGLQNANAASRFFAERQILASLVHPNIARLLDGGVTDDGTPYFVMDYVAGQPIDEYCDKHRLDVDARLDLFREVCAAIRYAHRNLVIHRDLKPGNVLVDEDRNVRLLDFGIAKILDPAFAGAELTQLGRRPMTAAYASPEMMRGMPVNTTSDVYSLGVLLYELLTGRLPYSLRGLTDGEIVARICEQEPLVASIVARGELSAADDEGPAAGSAEELAAERCSTPSQLCNKLRGDLDTILATALHKEADRRYQSVEQFEQDIARYRDGLPIFARPPTFGYRASRFVKRHKAGIAAAIVVSGSLIAVASLATLNAIRSAEQTRIIALERDKAEEIKDFLVRIFELSGPNESKGQTITARELLDSGTERIREELPGQPAVRSELMSTIALIYAELSMYEESEPLLAEAIELHADAVGNSSADYAGLLEQMTALKERTGGLDEAMSLASQAVSIRKAQSDPEGLADSLLVLGRILHRQGDLDSAENHYREAVDIIREHLGPRHIKVARAQSHLGTMLEHKGQLDAAEEIHLEVLAIKREVHGDLHMDHVETLHNLGSVLQRQGRLEEAIAHYEEALTISITLVPDGASGSFYLLNGLANVHQKTGDLDLAEKRYRESQQVLQKFFGPDHPEMGMVLAQLGRISMLKGDAESAEPLLREGVAVLERAAPNQQFLPDIRVALGDCLAETGQYDEAEQIILGSYGQLNEKLGPTHPRTKNAVGNLVKLYELSGNAAKADEYRALNVEQ